MLCDVTEMPLFHALDYKPTRRSWEYTRLYIVLISLFLDDALRRKFPRIATAAV